MVIKKTLNKYYNFYNQYKNEVLFQNLVFDVQLKCWSDFTIHFACFIELYINNETKATTSPKSIQAKANIASWMLKNTAIIIDTIIPPKKNGKTFLKAFLNMIFPPYNCLEACTSKSLSFKRCNKNVTISYIILYFI